MSKTLEELRTALGRATGLIVEGTAQNNAVATNLVDGDGLGRFTEADALNGGVAYILEDSGGAAPEGEWRFITDYDGAGTVTVEYAFTAAPTTDDLYEIYRVPLALDMWDDAINKAILDAWPEVWAPKRYTFDSTGGHAYWLDNTDIEEIERVSLRVYDEKLPRQPYQPLIRGIDYNTVRGSSDAGARVILDMIHPVSAGTYQGAIKFIVHYKRRYPELDAGDETDLDPAYILAAAQANLYSTLAGRTGGQADRDNYLQLMNFWKLEAQAQKQRLAGGVASIVNPAMAQGVKRG